jgi:NAD(P)H-flavin reductase
VSAEAVESPPVLDVTVPVPYRVGARHPETHDSVTLRLEPLEVPLPPFGPGQFTMLAVPGVGEIAVSVSGDPTRRDGVLEQTIRDVGAVSRALAGAAVGAIIGVRGPFGTGWDLGAADGEDVVIVAGGVGLAPLRPVVLAAVADRARFGRVELVVGARSPSELLFREQLAAWAAEGAVQVEVTVDVAAPGWAGGVGFVTEPLARLDLDPSHCRAFVCGPEAMMRFSADLMMRKGIPADRIRLSLERNMQCGIAQCGHCQLGPLLLCRDGPVVDYRTAAPLLRVPEL